MTAGTQSIYFVDGHVHIYDCFDLPQFFDAAFENFCHQAGLCRAGNDFTGVLLLSERTTENYFHTLRCYAEDDRSIESACGKQWFVRLTSESCSLLVSNGQGKSILVVSGRQLITRENLEVLALITDRSFPDGLPVSALIEEINRCGAVAILPWGVGKWTGKRGKIVDILLDADNRGKLFLGDNSGRPGFWPAPALFSKAEGLGIRVIPGSDPLPLKTEGRRCGSFGFVVREEISLDHPGRDLARILGEDAARIEPYGELESPVGLIRNQLLLRLA